MEEGEEDMPRTRPAYPAELRQKLVDLARSGRSIADLAREYEPSDNSIRSWVRQAERDGGVRTDGLTSDERQELIRCGREPSRRSREDEQLGRRIKLVHERSRGTYGAPRIHAELLANGPRVGRKRVARLMRQNGLRGVTRRKWTHTP